VALLGLPAGLQPLVPPGVPSKTGSAPATAMRAMAFARHQQTFAHPSSRVGASFSGLRSATIVVRSPAYLQNVEPRIKLRCLLPTH